jgi:hypothetical protein
MIGKWYLDTNGIYELVEIDAAGIYHLQEISEDEEGNHTKIDSFRHLKKSEFEKLEEIG